MNALPMENSYISITSFGYLNCHVGLLHFILNLFISLNPLNTYV